MDVIRAIYHDEPDGWWAESHAAPGWTAAAATVEELHRLVEDGLRFALERDDVIIEHTLDGSPAAVVFDFADGRARVPETPLGTAHAGHRQLQVA